jgi:hypothetical protein
VDNIVDATGAKLPDVRVDLEGNFLVADAKEDGLLGDPDEEHHDYTGNAGATVDRVRLHVRYLDRCMMRLMPLCLNA